MLQQLVSHAALRDLTVNLYSMLASAAAAASYNRMDVLCRVLSTCTRLESVTLTSLDLQDETWPLIAESLDSNPTIVSLKLEQCHFSKKAWTLLTNYYARDGKQVDLDTSTSQQQPSASPVVPKLHLIHCRFTQSNGTTSAHETIVQMLRGSKLEHLTIDLPTLSQQFGDAPAIADLYHFSTSMSEAASSSNKASSTQTQPIQLSSLQLDGFECRDLPQLWRYLRSTIHLRHLRVVARNVDVNGLHDHWFLLPRNFLSILRANGSLESVEIRDQTNKELRPSSFRVMEAIATRNRLLPQLLPAALLEKDVTGNGDNSNNGTPAPRAVASAKKRLSVTLCRAAQQAPRMAPNNVLKGLLAASDNAIGSTTSSCGTKRVAGG